MKLAVALAKAEILFGYLIILRRDNKDKIILTTLLYAEILIQFYFKILSVNHLIKNFQDSILDLIVEISAHNKIIIQYELE